MRLIDFDALKKLVEQRLDMQDLYLPVHFLDIAEELADKGPWKPFLTRQLTQEEREIHPKWFRLFECELPEDGQQILVTIVSPRKPDTKIVQIDYWNDDCEDCGLDSGWEPMKEATAWMPMPEAYQGE